MYLMKNNGAKAQSYQWHCLCDTAAMENIDIPVFVSIFEYSLCPIKKVTHKSMIKYSYDVPGTRTWYSA